MGHLEPDVVVSGLVKSLDNSVQAVFMISQPSAPRCVKIKSINVVGTFSENVHLVTARQRRVRSEA